MLTRSPGHQLTSSPVVYEHCVAVSVLLIGKVMSLSRTTHRCAARGEGAGADVAGRVPAAAVARLVHAVGDAGRHWAHLDALLPRHPPHQLLAVRVQPIAGAGQRRAVPPRAALPASAQSRTYPVTTLTWKTRETSNYN